MMRSQTGSLRPALLRGLLVMLGGVAIATVGIHLAVQNRLGLLLVGEGAWPMPQVAGLELWLLAGVTGALVMAIGWLLLSPVLRRADRICAEQRQAEVALERARRFDRSTGLPHRQEFERVLQKSLEVGRRHGYRVGLLLLQIDGWQRSTLRLTAEDAEAILRDVLTLISRNLRASDTMARIGTEEFAIVIGNVASSEAVVKLAERVLAKIETVAARHAEAGLTCSIGIAVTSPDETLEHHALVRSADEALAEAESGGGEARWRLHTGARRQAGEHLSLVT